MPTAVQVLGEFAADLQFSDIPPAVVESAKDCIIDTLAVSIFGKQFPWSRITADYARRYGVGGPCAIIGFPEMRVHAPYAALAHGVFAHAFEQDGSCEPNVGVHPGGTLVPAVLAACEEMEADGKTGITAFVAGCEVLLRVGAASHFSKTAPETLGFHVPGLNGPFGSAAGAGRAFGLNAEQIAQALGVAGSLSSGLLAFSRSGQGGMVKRLHIGRSAESGVLAAALARDGYTGPETALDGRFGFLDVFCRGGNARLLTADLGSEWMTLRLSMKRYPCAMFAHTAVEGMRELMSTHEFGGDDVARVVVEGVEKLASHHDIREPNDIMQAQYSLPFCVALAMYRDPEDPKSFAIGALQDPAIRAACRDSIEIRSRSQEGRSGYSTSILVELKDGRRFTRENDSFKGQPGRRLTRPELRQRFMLLSDSFDEATSVRLYERLETLEEASRFSLT